MQTNNEVIIWTQLLTWVKYLNQDNNNEKKVMNILPKTKSEQENSQQNSNSTQHYVILLCMDNTGYS